MSEHKNFWRDSLKQRRKEISSTRREEAKEALMQKLLPLLSSFQGGVLSFASLPDELEMQAINDYLAKAGRLYLPKVENHHLSIYRVTNLSHLTAQAFNLLEPNPHLCEKATPEAIGLVLVPGLGFDAKGHRLGYGKGHYDRLLPHLSFSFFWGIGFKEQFVELLPQASHDVALHHILLF